MTWSVKLLLTLLTAIIASQIVAGLVAWRDDAVATSWINELTGKRECLYDFSTLEARRLERLANERRLQLGVEDRLRVDCYLREAQNWRDLERKRRDSAKARSAMTQAATIGGLAVIFSILLLLFGWFSRRKDATHALSHPMEA